MYVYWQHAMSKQVPLSNCAQKRSFGDAVGRGERPTGRGVGAGGTQRPQVTGHASDAETPSSDTRVHRGSVLSATWAQPL